ncbi:MAG: hypothetical protein AB1644_05375 [Candidatus Zixiibacteriota bacterium]
MTRTTNVCSAALAAVLIAGSAYAALLQVPQDFSTVQGAVTAAATGDTVLVNDGTYYENIGITGKTIVLASEFLIDGDPQHILNTVLDGSQPSHPDTGSVLRVYQAGTTIIDGFSIVNGNGTAWRDISDNRIYREGGGILVEASDPIIRNNLIAGNSATIVGPGVTSAGGGGIRAGFTTVTLEGNVIADNTGLYGAGIVLFHAGGVIRNNTIVHNQGGSAFGGGGIWAWANSMVIQVFNNTIVNNISATLGGGIDVQTSTPEILNNLIWGNQAVTGPSIQLRGGTLGTIVQYNDVQGGFAGTGNINQTPTLNLANFLQDATSPCVDSGSSSVIHNDPEDLSNPGFALYPSHGTLRNDQGAYGGPARRTYPLFTDPVLAVLTDTVRYDTVRVGQFRSMPVQLHKANFGLIMIDSVRFRGSFASDLSTITTLPLAVGPALPDSLDSLQITWTPSDSGVMRDNMLVYHSCLSVANPLVVPLTGYADASCCHGVTGNLDGDVLDMVDISDLTALVGYLFSGGIISDCFEENDVDLSASVDISDLTIVVEFLFFGASLAACP